MTEPLKLLFTAYKPKAGFQIMANQSAQTDRFVAAVFKQTLVSKFSKEYCDAAIAHIIETDIKVFEEKLKPYIDKR